MGTAIPVNGNSTIRFSVFELDLKAGELLRNGSKTRLQEQPLQVLISLLERPGEVVTREELQRKLWPADTFVDFDHSLNAAVRRLRDALGDSADTPRFVETVARRGYRFIAPVSNSAPVKTQSTVEAQLADSEGTSATRTLQPIAPPSTGIPPYQNQSRKRYLVIAVAGMLIAGLIALHFIRRVPNSRFSQRRLTANRPEVPVLSAVLSNSGEFLAFSDTTGMYLRQVESGETHAILQPPGFNGNPVGWLPDDSHLLVTTTDATHAARLWRISLLGGEPHLLADNASSAVVSPDGSQVAFVRASGMGSSQEIWSMQANGEKPAKLLTCSGCFLRGLAWSPDGKQLAYVHQEYKIGSFWGFDTQLEVLNLSSGRSAVVASHVDHVDPILAWMADGRILYVGAEQPPNESDSNLWSVKLNSHTLRPEGKPERITNDSGMISAVSVSTDGKRIAILRRMVQPNVYVTDIENRGTRLSTPRLLTADEWSDYPTAWTADSKSILFFSDRDGVFHIFKQAIDQTQPELLVGGSEAVGLPRLSPDGSLVLYEDSGHDSLHIRPPQDSQAEIAPSRQRLMRVPVAGGPPQLVLEGTGISNFQCATSPSKLCVFSEFAPGEEHFYTFDPLKGKGSEISRALIRASDFYSFNWSLSPDGKFMAFSKKFGSEGEPAIRLLSLFDSTERLIPLPGWAGIQSLDWSADGLSVWATALNRSETASGFWFGFSERGTWTLLNVQLSGAVTPMLHETKMTLGWAIPAPDGKKLAVWMASGASNVWLLESQ